MLNLLKWRTVALCLGALACTNVLAAVPVIPGAAGFGINTPAGRGGKIIRVTNLNDSGAGSLRACVNEAGPRICVFEVSGTIKLATNIVASNPYLTIAGQTAPAPGIMLRGVSLAISTSHVLVQHLAIRPGDDLDGPAFNSRDAIKINKGASNIVIDHCSLSWGTDENIEAYLSWGDVTISNTIISEALDASMHEKGAHSYGGLFDTTNPNSKISFVRNLFAHNSARNPRSNSAQFVFVNNVVYNPRKAAVMLFNNDFTSNNSIVGNVFIDGRDTYDSTLPIRLMGSSDGNGTNSILSGTRLHLEDNSASALTGDVWSIVQNQTLLDLGSLKVLSAPAWPAGLKALTSRNGTVLSHVLENAGARPRQRDRVDARIVSDVRQGTGRIINCVSDNGSSSCAANAGGWPSLAKNTRRLIVPQNPNGDDNGDGYTNVEKWLHAMAAEVEGIATSPPELAAPNPPFLQN